MKFQLVILLVCLNALTLWADDHHHHHEKHHNHHDKHFHGAHQRHAVNHHQNRLKNRDLDNNSSNATTTPGPNCITLTPIPSNQNGSSNGSVVDVYYNANVTLVALHNSSAQIAILFNYSSLQVIVVTSQSAVYLNASTKILSDVSLRLNDQDFQSFFSNLSDLGSLLQNPSQNPPEPGATPRPITLTTSSGNSSPSPRGDNSSENPQSELLERAARELGFRSSNNVETLVALSNNFVHFHTHSIHGILVGSGHFNLSRGGVVRFVTVVRGLEDFFGFIPGGVQAVYKAGGKLDFAAIFNAPNGIQVLIRVLEGVRASSLNLSKILSGGLNDLETLLRILVLLGGNDGSNGVDRAIKLAYTILDIIRHRGGLNELFRLLVDFSNNGNAVSGAEIRAALDDLSNLAKSQAPGSLQVLINFLRNLNDNNLVLDGVDVSRVFILLRRGNVNGSLNLALSVLVHLSSVVNPAQSVPRFFGYILGVFNSRNAPFNVSSLLPGVNPQQLQAILQKGNFSELIKQGNLSSIPVLGSIVANFSASLQSVSNGSLNFQQILRVEVSAVASAFNSSSQGFTVFNDIIKNTFGSWIGIWGHGFPPIGLPGGLGPLFPPNWGPGPVLGPGLGLGAPSTQRPQQGSTSGPEATPQERRSKNRHHHHEHEKHLHGHVKHFGNQLKHHEKNHHSHE